MSKKYNFTLYAICLLSAAGLLLICSKSSPLYPLNDWPDLNCFYTIGKSMVHGKMPYVDLLDHKGPYVYALAAAAYLLDGHGFGGYFLFELVSMYFFLLYACKISSLYCEKTCLWMLPLLGMVVVSAKSFVHGGSWEQLSLGVFAYAIYSLLAFMRGPASRLSASTLILNGLLAGILLWSKFNLLGLYIAWGLAVLILYLRRRQWAALGKDILLFTGGAAASTLPWLVYFGRRGAVKAWLKVYLYDNIFLYGSGQTEISGLSALWRQFATALENIWGSLADRGNYGYSLPLLLGLCLFLLAPRRKVALMEKASVLLMGLGMALGIFIGSVKHDYYGLPLAVFAIWGLPSGSCFVHRLRRFVKAGTEKSWSVVALWAAVLCGSLVLAYRISPNTYLLLTDKAKMPQYRFAEQILASEDTSLLNYMFLDGGFYTVTGEVPTVKTFQVINMDRARRIQEQEEYVRQQLTHWVVTWRAQETSEEELRSMNVLSEYYELVDYMYFYFEGDMRTYALYERK